MALVDQIKDELKAAMKAKDKVRLTTIRSVRAAFLEAQKADGSDTLSDDKALAVLRKLAKSRTESITAYNEAGRPELAEGEAAELAILESYLPSLADAEQTRAWAVEAIAASGASAPSDMGKVMGQLMRHHKAEMDGKLAQQIVRELLTAG